MPPTPRASSFASRIPEFDQSTRSWFSRLQYFFDAEDITEDRKKKAHLLTLCSEETYETVCALVQPKTPATVSCDELVTILATHFDPRQSEVYDRTLFQRRDQLPGESISAYTAALRKLAADCNFDTPDPATRALANPPMLPLDVMLRDRFVCGLHDAHIQQRLFSEQDLSFKMAFDIALQAEGSVKQQRDLKSPASEVQQAATTS